LLSQAAVSEELTLRKLRGTFQKSGEPTAAVPGDVDGGGDGERATSTEEELVVSDPTLFDAFDAEIVLSNTFRLQAADDLASIIRQRSQENQQAVEAFALRYELLSQEWDDFHTDYDDWRASDGGCNRETVITALGAFSLRLGALADQVRELPRAPFLRPLGELFVAAVEQEDEAFRALRNAWRPFDSVVFQVFDDERTEVNRLRRQVAAGVEDRLPRFAISAEDVESGAGR
jgi:hypothetical protein